MSEFVRVCAVDEVAVNTPRKVEIGDQQIAIVKDSSGEVFAIGNTCSHGEIELSEGFVEDGEIECWAHGAKFSLRTGAALTLPAFQPVPIYDLKIEAGDIHVDPTPKFAEEAQS